MIVHERTVATEMLLCAHGLAQLGFRRGPIVAGSLAARLSFGSMGPTAAAAASRTGTSTRRTLRGVVFDMDGTLTIPVIDFADMRRRVGVPQGKDILDAISSWPAAEQAKAYATIKEIEDEALVNMKVMPGAQELCKFLDGLGIPRGLITRNVKSSIEYFHTNAGLDPFKPAISRECNFAYKPSPAALLHICETWGVPPSECAMVGDSVKDDIVCGNRAGSVTVLLDFEGKARPQAPQGFEALEGEQRPAHVVGGLTELLALLRQTYELVPPERQGTRSAAAVEAIH